MLDLPATMPSSVLATAIANRLADQGFDLVPGSRLRPFVACARADAWDGYAASWGDLEPDTFMADGGTYRRRRFACFRMAGGEIRTKPSQPHYQSKDNNPLNGGVARVFAPVRDAIAFHPVNVALLGLCAETFGKVRAATAWHVEMHQFRIEARGHEAGLPTPEGMHRDGVDFVLVAMIGRENVQGGVSTIADAAHIPCARTALSEPLDSCFLDDRRVFHGVSPVEPVDASRPAHRDVLVLTFRAEEG